MVRGGDKEREVWSRRERAQGDVRRGGAEWHLLNGNWQFSLCGLSLSHT